jgi:hypothetical protein
MLTTNADPLYEQYAVEVTCSKYGLDEHGALVWRGHLPDVEPDTRGVRAYQVREGTWIEVHLLNRGVEVALDLTCCEVYEGVLTRGLR